MLQFTHALTRLPTASLAKGQTTHPELGSPNYDLTLQQYQLYLSALNACGLSVHTLPDDPAYPDGHYVEDTAVIFGQVAFITGLGVSSRKGEQASIIPHFSSKQLVFLQGDEASLEGGDVLFCHDRVLIGLSQRTNRAGADQLAAALRAAQASIKVQYLSLSGVLHLKTGLTEIAPGVLVKNPQMQVEGDLSFAEVISLAPDQGYAANVLPINDHLIIPAGYPQVEDLANRYHHQIHRVPMSEFKKMDGSLTCLSLRYEA
jgi:dimethylargininase